MPLHFDICIDFAKKENEKFKKDQKKEEKIVKK